MESALTKLESEIILPSAPTLNSSLFLDPDFDPSRFLLERRHTPLDELRAELREYLAELKSDLIAVINLEYESFIGLSLGLRKAQISTSLHNIKRPVLEIRTEVQVVQSVLESMKLEMEGLLQQRKEVREAKALLKRLLEVESAVEKVEGLLMLSDPGEGISKSRIVERTTDSPSRRIERIAGEYNQMLYLVEKAGDFPFVRSLEPRISRITTTLSLDLANLFTSLLSPATPSSSPKISHSHSFSYSAPSPIVEPLRESLTTVLKTYSSLGLIEPAQELIRKIVVRPFTINNIHRDVLSSIEPGLRKISISPDSLLDGSGALLQPFSQKRDTCYDIEPIGHDRPGEVEPLGNLYNKILRFISDDCGMLLDITERSVNNANMNGIVIGEKRKLDKRPGGNYDLLTKVIWEEIGNRLMSELGHVIFAAGRPNVFHQNYILSQAFLSRLEELSPSLSALELFQSDSTTTSFLKRFQLPVYFQLRFKEVIGAVERVLNSNPVSKEEGSNWMLKESEIIWNAIGRCWDEQVFLEELNFKFWKLTLQMLARYRQHLISITPKLNPANNPTGLNAGTTSTRASFDSGYRPSDRGGTPNTRPSTPSGQNQNPFEELSHQEILKLTTIIIIDSHMMAKQVQLLFDSKMAKMLPKVEEEDITASVVISTSLTTLLSPLPQLSSQILQILTNQALDSLKHVKSVANQVRASNKTTPNEPSYFVRLILKDLKIFLDGVGAKIGTEMQLSWKQEIVNAVALKYSSILLRQKETDESLKRLKKGNRQGGALSFFGRSASNSGPEESELDSKVTLQMQIDVTAFMEEAKSIGVKVEELQPVQALRDVVFGV